MSKYLSARLVMLISSLLVWPLAVSATDPDVGLLLRWKITTQELGPPDPTTEYLIYRDGLVIQRTLPSTEHENVSYLRAVAAPAALRRLKTALAQNRVGLIQAPANCKAVSPFPTSVEYTSDLTWFGKNGRQNRFSTSNFGSEGCPIEVNNLILSIVSGFLPELSYQDLVTTLP